MRPLRQASPLVRVIATLGVLVTLQSIAILRYEVDAEVRPSKLPTDVWTISGEIVISADRVILLGIAAVSTLALWALYRFTTLRPGDLRRGRERARRRVARAGRPTSSRRSTGRSAAGSPASPRS